MRGRCTTRSLGLQKSSAMAMHPLVAVAQAKLQSAKPPHRPLTLDWLTEWVAAAPACPSTASTR